MGYNNFDYGSNLYFDENNNISFNPLVSMKQNNASTPAFINKEAFSVKLNNDLTSTEDQGFWAGITNWWEKPDNVDLTLDLLGKGLQGLMSWSQGNKTYELGKEALQNNINGNRALFTANAANALDKKNLHTLQFNAAMKDAAPDAVAQNNRNAMAYAQALGNAAQQIGINPNTITNQLQQYNQLKA